MAAEDPWVWVPFEVDKKFDGCRIDQFLAHRLTGYSRNRVQKILEEARVHKEGKPAKNHGRVKTGDKIEVAYQRRPEQPLDPKAALSVLYEDDDLLLVDKPANLLSHPTDKVVKNTVLGILRQSRSDTKPLHLLHRLDRETSGVLALAKHPAAARAWTRAMERHSVKKMYLALVRGIPQPLEGVMDRPIGPQGGDIHVRQWVDVEGAAQASTRYATLKTFDRSGDPISWVSAFPQTGRLHQIRVHFSSRGTPLLGDPLYTGDGALYRKMIKGELSDGEREKVLGFPRVALHAARLELTHPMTGKPLVVESPCPEDLRQWHAAHTDPESL
jgi:23S rRNA pseudouridine1911/1915/1917 synthase